MQPTATEEAQRQFFNLTQSELDLRRVYLREQLRKPSGMGPLHEDQAYQYREKVVRYYQSGKVLHFW